MKFSLLRLAVLGVIVLAAGWWWRDSLGEIGEVLASAGWGALAAIILYHAIPLLLCGLAWRVLASNIGLAPFVLARWVREGVNELAAFLPLAGEIVATRVLALRTGLTLGPAGATTVVDITVESLAQFVFTLLGVGLLLTRHPGAEPVRWALIGLALSVPALAGMILAQRSGLMRVLETLPGRMLPKVWRVPEIEQGIRYHIHAIYKDGRRIWIAILIHLAGWFLAIGEAWLALAFLGHRLVIPDLIGLESVVLAVRSASFLIPGALGIQEGAYILVGAMFGLPADIALSVSLLKRGRELVLGLPAVFAWQALERKKTSAAPAP
jgi:putative membrane protein